jgi:predicted O-linked N-acetylglucosamine transferase (SPINDLY family)
MSPSGSYSGDSPQINLFNQAFALHRRGEFEAAQKIYKEILQSDSKNAEVLHLLGVIALQKKDFPSAIKFISQAIEINPQMSVAFNNLGAAYKEQKDYVKALESLQCALKLDPVSADALSNIGNIYSDEKKYSLAMDFYYRAIKANPHHADAYYNRGNIYLHSHKYALAVGDYNRALEFDPGITDAYLNRGLAYKKMGNYQAALTDFSQVVKMQPGYAEAYYHRAITCFSTNDNSLAAFEDLKSALQINSKLDYLLSAFFFRKKFFADWSDLEALGSKLLEMAKSGDRAITPFTFVSHFDDPSQQLMITKTWINAQSKSGETDLGSLKKSTRKEKIHIGYFSSDFNEHAVTYASAGLFRSHDKSKFKITGFYFGRHKDSMLARVAGYFDEFYNVADLSDVEVTELARKLKIDIAVDLNGSTAGARPVIFLNQAATIQVNYLGYPGTMGTPIIDYIIADEYVIPVESQKYYIEKIAYMDCFMAHDDQLLVSGKKYSKSELGLPTEGFIFCGFNNTHKITPKVWSLWMNILKSVPNSVLWLSCGNDFTTQNLLREALACGVESTRIIFAPKFKDIGEHLARLRCADLLLDTYPYNAHTTASAALWAGLPVLTRSGESFASRVAASLLCTCHLPELIVRTDEEYQSRAIDLANNPMEISDIKKRLSDYRDKNPLFDTASYTRKLENLFCQMYERGQLGLIPENLNFENEPIN